MTEKKRRLDRLVWLYCAVLILLLVFSAAVFSILSQEMRQFYKKDLKQAVSGMEEEFSERASHEKSHKEAFDRAYTAKARFIVYSAEKDLTFERTDEKMKTYKDQLKCTKIFLVDRNGAIKARSTAQGDKVPNFTKNRYNELRTVFDEDKTAVPFDVKTKDGKTIRYYAAKADENTEVVIGKDTKDLKKILTFEEDWERSILPFLPTDHSYAYVVSDLTGQILYDTRGSEETDTIEVYLKEAGVSDPGLSYGARAIADDTDKNQGKRRSLFRQRSGVRKVQGDYYGIVWMPDQQAYTVMVVPKEDLAPCADKLIGALVIILFAVMVMMILSGSRKENGTAPAVRIGAAGAVVLFLFSFYALSLYRISLDDYKKAYAAGHEVQMETARKEYAETITDYYNGLVMNHTEAAARVLGNNPDLRKRKELNNICEALDLDYILMYDKDLKQKTTNSEYVNLNLSKEEDDPFYSLSKLRFGVSKLIWGPADDPVTEKYHQYLGVVIKEKGNPNGCILASVTPEEWLKPVYEWADLETKDEADADKGSVKNAYKRDKAQDRRIRETAFEQSLPVAGLGIFAVGIVAVLLIMFFGDGRGSAQTARQRLLSELAPEREEADSDQGLKPWTFLRWVLIAVSAGVVLALLLPTHFIGEYSVFNRIIEGAWTREPGTLSLTACLLGAAAALFAGALLGALGQLPAKVVGEETGQKIRMCVRFVQGILVLTLIGACLFFLGMPVTVMVAGLVLVILVVGFGGNTFFGDAASGLYLMGAGIFHVGDLVRIGDVSGEVKELRLTHAILENEKKEQIILANRKVVGSQVVLVRSREG